jgi:hypothetical protein
MGQLRDMAAQAAAEANGDLGRTWEIFVPRFIAAAGEIDLSTDLAELAPRLPVHGSAADEVLRQYPDDDEKAIKMLAEMMDAREYPTFKRPSPEGISECDRSSNNGDCQPRMRWLHQAERIFMIAAFYAPRSADSRDPLTSKLGGV